MLTLFFTLALPTPSPFPAYDFYVEEDRPLNDTYYDDVASGYNESLLPCNTTGYYFTKVFVAADEQTVNIMCNSLTFEQCERTLVRLDDGYEVREYVCTHDYDGESICVPDGPCDNTLAPPQDDAASTLDTYTYDDVTTLQSWWPRWNFGTLRIFSHVKLIYVPEAEALVLSIMESVTDMRCYHSTTSNPASHVVECAPVSSNVCFELQEKLTVSEGIQYIECDDQNLDFRSRVSEFVVDLSEVKDDMLASVEWMTKTVLEYVGRIEMMRHHLTQWTQATE